MSNETFQQSSENQHRHPLENNNIVIEESNNGDDHDDVEKSDKLFSNHANVQKKVHSNNTKQTAKNQLKRLINGGKSGSGGGSNKPILDFNNPLAVENNSLQSSRVGVERSPSSTYVSSPSTSPDKRTPFHRQGSNNNVAPSINPFEDDFVSSKVGTTSSAHPMSGDQSVSQPPTILNDNVVVNTEKEEKVRNNHHRTSPADKMKQKRAQIISKVVDSQVEISLNDDDKKGKNVTENDAQQILTNATDFLLENNENCCIGWQEASYRIGNALEKELYGEDGQFDEESRGDVGNTGTKPSRVTCNIDYIRWLVRRVVENLWFRIFTLLLIILDIVLVITYTFTLHEDPYYYLLKLHPLQISDFILTCYFVLEVIARIFALTHPVFFAIWYNVLDMAIVLITFILACVGFSGSPWAQHLSLLTVIRLIRLIRIIRLCTEKKQFEIAARQVVSQNKRRFKQDGFDLDLTYVTSRVIATSFPSSGIWAWYRNPIERVATYLDSKHRDHYKVYNLCSERSYSSDHFHGRVERYMIDDHNVPSIEDMRRFASSVKNWLHSHPQNVIVVHCKGGKGRTGTMICVWLIEAKIFTKASQSLQYFGQRRTDAEIGRKFQGVETPSQSRYVGYYETLKEKWDSTASLNQPEQQIPQDVKLRITKILISGMMHVGKGDGTDFWLTINQQRDESVFSAHFGYQRNCQTTYESSNDLLTVNMQHSPVLEGDVRLMFQTSSLDVPKGYESCPFYFWFHTAFIPSTSDRLTLKREDLDNPHKSKTWHVFLPNFKVEVFFERLS